MIPNDTKIKQNKANTKQNEMKWSETATFAGRMCWRTSSGENIPQENETKMKQNETK
jgi:hypothetical protein